MEKLAYRLGVYLAQEQMSKEAGIKEWPKQVLDHFLKSFKSVPGASKELGAGTMEGIRGLTNKMPGKKSPWIKGELKGNPWGDRLMGQGIEATSAEQLASAKARIKQSLRELAPAAGYTAGIGAGLGGAGYGIHSMMQD